MSLLSGDCNVCINRKMPSYSATCIECGLSRKNYKPTTNADKIRQMNFVELTQFLAENFDCACCPAKVGDDCQYCLQAVADWLKKEAE